jgi:hypothetical protein
MSGRHQSLLHFLLSFLDMTPLRQTCYPGFTLYMLLNEPGVVVSMLWSWFSCHRYYPAPRLFPYSHDKNRLSLMVWRLWCWDGIVLFPTFLLNFSHFSRATV